MKVPSWEQIDVMLCYAILFYVVMSCVVFVMLVEALELGLDFGHIC